MEAMIIGSKLVVSDMVFMEEFQPKTKPYSEVKTKARESPNHEGSPSTHEVKS